MTLYLILGRHGARIHPVSNRDRDNIRYLPLLVLKDMIKSNLNDRIRYIKDHKKTVVFFEHTELHYIAISKTNSHHLLLHHLIIIQSYLSFMYGPAFATRLSTTQPSPFQPNRASLSPISPEELSSAAARMISLCRLNPYLAVQPIQVSEDLRKRFRASLREGCDHAFAASEKRKSSFGSAFQALSMQSMREEPTPLPNGSWSHAMLWVQDKLLVRVNNGSADRSPYDIDSNELLAVLILVQGFLKAHGSNDTLYPGDQSASSAHQNTKPQMIRTSRSSNHSLDTHHSRTPESTNSSTIATPPSSGGYVPSSFALSNKSSASNISSITNVTPVVSFSTPPQLSLMLFSNQNPSIHTTDSVSISDNDSIAHSEPVSISRSQSRPESCHSGSFGSTLSADHEPRPVSVPIGHHRRGSPVSSDPLSSSLSLLSSSLPASSALSYPTNQKTGGVRRPVNAMGRQHQRSRSSVDSLSKLLPPVTPEPSESKVTTAWFNVGEELQEKSVYLGQVSEGVTLVVIYDPPKVSPRHVVYTTWFCYLNPSF
ncbi:hypothetical protein BC943DRAFT_119370 [Umbelopsis sp. AD052]|nr:hypothetical protein BC943DRAFT_119370 [Umbelopsis sp. AD052]